MRIMNSRPWYVDYLFIFMGTGIMALAIQCIFEPIGLVTGGFSGIAIIIRKMTAGIVEGGVPLWLTNLALNVPVFTAALIIKGRKLLGRTVIGTVFLSFWLYVIPQVDLTQGDYMLSAVFGGVITGIGIGFVLLAKATTGGTDMVSALIQKYVRHYSVVQILQVIDGWLFWQTFSYRSKPHFTRSVPILSPRKFRCTDGRYEIFQGCVHYYRLL